MLPPECDGDLLPQLLPLEGDGDLLPQLLLLEGDGEEREPHPQLLPLPEGEDEPLGLDDPHPPLDDGDDLEPLRLEEPHEELRLDEREDEERELLERLPLPPLRRLSTLEGHSEHIRTPEKLSIVVILGRMLVMRKIAKAPMKPFSKVTF